MYKKNINSRFTVIVGPLKEFSKYFSFYLIVLLLSYLLDLYAHFFLFNTVFPQTFSRKRGLINISS